MRPQALSRLATDAIHVYAGKVEHREHMLDEHDPFWVCDVL